MKLVLYGADHLTVSREDRSQINTEQRRTTLLDTKQPARARSYITLPGYRKGQAPRNAGMKLPAEPLTREEVDQLLAACSPTSSAGLRNRALIVVIWRAGLRIAEAVALLPRDVDLGEGRIRVRHGKGQKARLVGIDPQACAVIECWMERRRKLGLTARDPIFSVYSRGHGGQFGKPIYTSYVRDMLKRLARRAGIERRVHPHGFRHTHAFELANESVPLDVIRMQLGHSSIRVTARYVEHLNPVAVIGAMRARTWNDEDDPNAADEMASLVTRLEAMLAAVKHEAPVPA